MTGNTLIKSDLASFTGTEQWYRHGLMRKVLYTDGVKYVADTGGAYWLIDEIAFGQAMVDVAREEFQVWKLTVNSDQTATLSCEDGNYRIIITKKIEYTDFPMNEIVLYYRDNVLMLPSEY